MINPLDFSRSKPIYFDTHNRIFAVDIIYTPDPLKKVTIISQVGCKRRINRPFTPILTFYFQLFILYIPYYKLTSTTLFHVLNTPSCVWCQ
jgi:hypothetical protein